MQMTSTATFALMHRLTSEERAEIECRYDGPIPYQAVQAIIDRHGAPAPTYSLAVLDRMRRDLEFAAQQNRTMARQLVRSAKRCKAFGANSPDAGIRRRTRETVGRYFDDIRETRAMASRLQAEARNIADQLAVMMADASAQRAAAQ